MQSFVSALTKNFIISGNLSENVVYSFRVLVSNIVGVVSTDKRMFCKSTSVGVVPTIKTVMIHYLQTQLMYK